jgi:IS5 family transposase
VLHAKALHGNPYDGHTLGPVIADLEKLTGAAVLRIHGDKGFRGHNYPDRFKVWISGQVRRVTKAIRREMRRRADAEKRDQEPSFVKNVLEAGLCKARRREAATEDQ